MKKFRFVCLLICFQTTYAIASHAIDTTLILDLVKKAKSLQHSDPEAALQIGFEVRNKSIKAQYQRGIAYGAHRIGSLYFNLGQFDSADHYLKESFSIRTQRRDHKLAAGTAIILSMSLNKIGQADSAMNVLITGAKLAELSHDSGQIISSYVELGSLNLDYGYLDKSEYYLSKALQIAKDYKDPYFLARTYLSYGAYYFYISRFTESLNQYKIAKRFFVELNLQFDIALCNENIALCHVNLKNYHQALSSFQESKDVYVKLGYMEDLSVIQFNIGSMFNELGKLDSAQFYLSNALTLSKVQGDVEQSVSIYEVLADVANKKGNYQQAFEYQQQFSVLSDSLLDAQKVTSLAEMQTKYETEKKEQQIVLLDQENKTKAAQKKYLIAGTIALSLGLFVLGFYYVQRQKLAKKNALIAKQKIETILDEQEIKTYNAMLEGQEEERMRISADLHDRLGSMLSTIKLMFNALGEKVDNAQAEQKAQYDKATDLIDNACVEVRRISHNLGTGMVASFGLIKSLEELADGLAQTGKINCTFQYHGTEETLPTQVEIEIYRIVQEAVNNTIKHANASSIVIQLNRLEDELNLHIEDDGDGFDVVEKKSTGGLGLASLDKRAQKIDGNLHIDSYPGRGTTIVLEIPLVNE